MAYTPGRAAHESLRETGAAAFGRPVDNFPAWEAIPQGMRDRMAAAARAELAAYTEANERDEHPVRQISYPLGDDEVRALREQGIIGDDGTTMMDRFVEQAFADSGGFALDAQTLHDSPGSDL